MSFALKSGSFRATSRIELYSSGDSPLSVIAFCKALFPSATMRFWSLGDALLVVLVQLGDGR